MKKQTQCAFKTSVGGQALMEGIMMRGPKQICCAVRRPDGTIDLSLEPVPQYPWRKIPLVRGVCAMVESIVTGYRYLMHSAEISMGEDWDAEEEETRFERWLGDRLGDRAQAVILGFSALLGVALAILLFTVLPTLIVGGIGRVADLGRWPKTILEACIKLAVFLGYLTLCSRMKEIHRVFQYHGAEHKTIACYEAGDALTVENIRRYPRFHPRCGTSFLVLILILSIFIYSVLPWGSMALRVLYKLLLLPLVMGIGYELLKLCGRYDNLFTRILRAPGLWVQRLTVFEPDDRMIETAIAAVTPVLPEKPEDGKW